ncbi:uncharacterized protein SETTUDRAFT_171272 [Exserohilum turcica Et28A]|uniref:SET domain-containing protein n=1 Tax=Exserohilum turcicum (strain 28A) TaxID=671987 RepID=R0K1D9_EXST2|nr:uncharacterized protein SETTUDRAFT_171272 [Exserohilum turcica Et28A]EOA86973.1 hypothetical protein SETTUDRAFT_171272 [Exserohilum turcica Et28A]
MNSLHVYFALGVGACALAASHVAHGSLQSQLQTPLRLQQCLDTNITNGGSNTAEVRPPAPPPPFEHAVWSHKPVCVSGKEKKDYCTHTTAGLRDGHGLSIIATPRAADEISVALPSGKNKLSHSRRGLEVRLVPGKGKGLFTTKSIAKGETILLDPARIIASSLFPRQVSRAQGKTLFSSAIDRLPGRDREAVAALDQSLGGTQIEDIVKTNAFACKLADGNVDGAYMCVFPSVSRINHACQPNAHARFIPRALSMEVKAKRDIAAGEEINISYGRIDLSYDERQELYKDGWNFACTCSLCSASRYEIDGSDRRRVRFARLRQMLKNLTADTYDAHQVLEWETEVMAIAQSEGLEVLLAEDYERLAYVYVGQGMLKDARRWAEKAKQSLLDWDVADGGPEVEMRRVNELLSEL